MDTKASATLVVLRLLLGWYMFFAGLEKVLNPAWTAQGFLLSAKTFPNFYAWFAAPGQAWWVDPLNAWGILLVGAALLVGVAIRPAAFAGVALMALYYFPHNVFPVVPHGYIIEEHFIYGAAFLLVAFIPQSQRFGLGNWLRKTFVGRIPVVRSLL